MTKARRKCSLGIGVLRFIAAMSAGLLAHPLSAAPAAERTPFWYDLDTGIAISGYDPLAYVLSARPELGEAQYEYMMNGLTWRFVNPGNRDAFAQAPDIYAPAFGGYDPVGLSRGVLNEGNPLIWTRYDGRLLLFYSASHFALWQDDKERYLEQAEANWPDLARTAPRLPDAR